MFPNTPSTPNISVEKRCFFCQTLYLNAFFKQLFPNTTFDKMREHLPPPPQRSVLRNGITPRRSPHNIDQWGRGELCSLLFCQTLYLNFREILGYYKTLLSAYGVASLRASRKKYVVVEDSRPGSITVHLCSASLRRILGCIGSKGVLVPISLASTGHLYRY